MTCKLGVAWWVDDAYLASLSIWSPKPGVSTMVRAMRTPSSSSSVHTRKEMTTRQQLLLRTDVDRLDPDTLFDMRSLRAIADFMLQDLRFAQGVHKRRAAGARSTCSMEGENAYHADASRTPKLQ